MRFLPFATAFLSPYSRNVGYDPSCPSIFHSTLSLSDKKLSTHHRNNVSPLRVQFLPRDEAIPDSNASSSLAALIQQLKDSPIDNSSTPKSLKDMTTEVAKELAALHRIAFSTPGNFAKKIDHLTKEIQENRYLLKTLSLSILLPILEELLLYAPSIISEDRQFFDANIHRISYLFGESKDEVRQGIQYFYDQFAESVAHLSQLSEPSTEKTDDRDSSIFNYALSTRIIDALLEKYDPNLVTQSGIQFQKRHVPDNHRWKYGSAYNDQFHITRATTNFTFWDNTAARAKKLIDHDPLENVNLDNESQPIQDLAHKFKIIRLRLLDLPESLSANKFYHLEKAYLQKKLVTLGEEMINRLFFSDREKAWV